MQHKKNWQFTKADKGGAVVIIDIEDYAKQTEDQLNNKDAYKKPQSYPRQTHARLMQDPIARFKNDKTLTWVGILGVRFEGGGGRIKFFPV